MTLNILTSMGTVKIHAPFKISKKIREKVKMAFVEFKNDEASLENMNSFLKKLNPMIDSPGASLQAWLSLKGWTQKILSRMSGISQAHISSIMHNKRPIGVAIAKRLGQAFGIDYKEFL